MLSMKSYSAILTQPPVTGLQLLSEEVHDSDSKMLMPTNAN